MRRLTTPQLIAPIAVAAWAAVALTGCVAASPTATTTSSSSSETPGGGASAAPKADLTGTAGQNQAYFDGVNQKLIAAGGDLSGRPFIDNLVRAGFPKSAMEVTPDRTTVNAGADNISFSIRFGSTCLIGQYGDVGYASTVAKLLSTGHCLVGVTRSIDW